MLVISPYQLHSKYSLTSQGFSDNLDPEGADVLQVSCKNGFCDGDIVRSIHKAYSCCSSTINDGIWLGDFDGTMVRLIDGVTVGKGLG